MRNIHLTDRAIGAGSPAFIIGEVGQAHDGSLGMAHAFIDAIADAGADAVKFQTHIAAAEGTSEETFRVEFSYQDNTRQDYWRRMEFTELQWAGLAQHAKARNLLFLSSPFSIEAVDLLRRVGVPAWKIASGEVTNYPMFDHMVKTQLPIFLSSGMSPWKEIDATIQYLQDLGANVALFQCTTSYPSPPEKIGLNVLQHMIERYQIPVGLSDHSGTIFPGLAAITLGASLLEVHVTLSREAFGPDVPASVTTHELKELVNGTRSIERMLRNPVNKDELSEGFETSRHLFFKSIVLNQDLSKHTVLTHQHLTTKKPGTGIPANHWAKVIGRTLARNVKKDELFSERDLA